MKIVKVLNVSDPIDNVPGENIGLEEDSEDAVEMVEIPDEPDPEHVLEAEPDDEDNTSTDSTKKKHRRSGKDLPTEVSLYSDSSDNYDIMENFRKKIKLGDDAQETNKSSTDDAVEMKVLRCDICKQYEDEAIKYTGHPDDAVEEHDALTDERLVSFYGKKSAYKNKKCLYKIIYFNVYDENGHLCPFDTGLLEANKLLYFSGYLKSIYNDDSSSMNAVPTKDMGPIREWWITEFEITDKPLVGVSTAFADYYLDIPSAEYKPLMAILKTKIILTRYVIEYLINERWREPAYEDLLQKLAFRCDSMINEDTLLKHAQFICDQIVRFDLINREEPPLITAPCMRTLVKMTGATFKNRYKMRRIDSKIFKRRPISNQAATTKLVYDVFQSFFDTNVANRRVYPRLPQMPCGICAPCLLPDCGNCIHCRDMVKFGGTGRTKQPCKTKKCPSIEMQKVEDEFDEEAYLCAQEVNWNRLLACSREIIHEVIWAKEPIGKSNSNTYYDEAIVGDMILRQYDFVLLNPVGSSKLLRIAKICYMWQNSSNETLFHGHLFCRGLNTILGTTADPWELFVVDVCDTFPLGCIVSKTEVEFKKYPKLWSLMGEVPVLTPIHKKQEQRFFYNKRYISASSRFESYIETPTDEANRYTPCDSCTRSEIAKKKSTPIFKNEIIHWYDDVYKVGTGIFLQPHTFYFKPRPIVRNNFTGNQEQGPVNETIHTEYYRKPRKNVISASPDAAKPFCIGIIEKITITPTETICLDVRKFYRPENTQRCDYLVYLKDLNLLYWSSEVETVEFSKVTGKCYIAYIDALDVCTEEWTKNGPYRFYFYEGYDKVTQTFFDAPPHSHRTGLLNKGKGIGKGKSNKSNTDLLNIPSTWVQTDRLKCMDVFAGCGGFSEGLRLCGISETLWAIENDSYTARTFKLNSPSTAVHIEDCNEVLRLAMCNNNENRKKLPPKGVIEMIIGGPPCYGLTGTSPFTVEDYTSLKNSYVVTFLSYCDYYRPHYIIMENVRNFTSYKRGMVFKLTLRCLLSIGYQITFGILQAGHYGVPQTRCPLIIMAAAPGYILPKFPEPLHAFSKEECKLAIVVDNFKYTTAMRWIDSAPYRPLTVRDGISDLPDIRNGRNFKELPYESDPNCHYQRMMRKHDPDGVVKEHVSKEMPPLAEARMVHIPKKAGADWRNLPNIEVQLNETTCSNILKYPYKTDDQQENDPPRGVCACISTGECEPTDCQSTSLIPWCLAHTADKHKWAGMYGRLDWDGFMPTIPPYPEPMGTEGKVVHPEQHRLISIRECARAQGFMDAYQFFGNIHDRYQQIGIAIPPPLGTAIGRELQKAYAATTCAMTK